MKNSFDEIEIDSLHFDDDGTIPNSRLPVLVYRNAISNPDIEHVLRQALEKNCWSGIWINGIYDFHPYHSTAHEFLGVVAGKASLLLGGKLGKVVNVEAGDCIVLPAGTGHKGEECSKDFSLLGAYPEGQDWDLCKGKPGERPQALENILRAARPLRDPLYGPEGPLMREWT